MLELKVHSEKLLKDNDIAIQAQQRAKTTFFIPITHAARQSRDTQVGSRRQHNERVTIDRAIAIFHAHRPSLMDNDLTPLVIDR